MEDGKTLIVIVAVVAIVAIFSMITSTKQKTIAMPMMEQTMSSSNRESTIMKDLIS